METTDEGLCTKCKVDKCYLSHVTKETSWGYVAGTMGPGFKSCTSDDDIH
jgi:hypothetical protein